MTQTTVLVLHRKSAHEVAVKQTVKAVKKEEIDLRGVMAQFSSWIRRAVIILSLILLYSPAFGQAESDTTSVQADSVVVTLSTFIADMNDATFRLDNIQASLKDSATVANGIRQEAAFSADVDSLRNVWLVKSRLRLSLIQLDDMMRSWQRLETMRGGWADVLDDLALSHTEENQWITSVKNTWDQVSLEANPEELAIYADRVDLFLQNLDDVSALLREQLGIAVGLADNLALDGKVIDDSKRRIEEMRVEVRLQYLRRDGSVLFFFGSPVAAGERLTTKVTDTFRDIGAIIRKFYKESQGSINVHLGLVVVLLLFAVYVYRRRRAWVESEDEYLRGAAHIIAHPFSAAFLLALSTTSPLHPYAPSMIVELSLFITLIPLLRLIPGMIPAGMIRPFYGFMAIFVSHEIISLTSVHSLFGRVLLLALTALLIYGITHLLRSESYQEGVSSERGVKALRWLLRVVLAIAVISVVANLGGFLSLSGFVAEAVFSLMYDGFLLYTALQLFEGGWTVLIRSSFARRLKAIDHSNDLFITRGHATLRFLAVLAWFSTILSVLGLDIIVSSWIQNFFTFSLEIGALSIHVGSIVTFIAMMWVAVLFSRFIRFILEKDVYGRLGLGRGIPSAISTLTNYAILAIGFILAFSAAGMNFESFAIVVGAFGIGIGFGLQTIVNNFLSGLILIFERPIKVGDMIEVAGADGSILANVKRIGIRSSSVRTVDGAEVIMPNANLIANDVINWTKSDRNRRIDINIGVAYGTRLRAVQEILLKATSENSDVTKDPGPLALFTGFGDSSLDFILRFWTSNFDNAVGVKSEVAIAVNDALLDAGIEIPFPQRDLNIRSGLQEGEKSSTKAAPAPAAESPSTASPSSSEPPSV